VHTEDARQGRDQRTRLAPEELLGQDGSTFCISGLLEKR
jgi:hypothetical protein